MDDGDQSNDLTLFPYPGKTKSRVRDFFKFRKTKPGPQTKLNFDMEAVVCTLCYKEYANNEYHRIRLNNIGLLMRMEMDGTDGPPDYACSPCSETNEVTKASHYCPECDGYYCKVCLCDHTVHGRALIEQWGIPRSSQPFPQSKHEDTIAPLTDENRCLSHTDYEVQFYCEDDDVVCCKVCLAINHRKCTRPKPIETVTKYETLDDDSKDSSDMLEMITAQLEFARNEIKLREISVESSHKLYVEHLESYRRNVNAVFDNIKAESKRLKCYLFEKLEANKILCQTTQDNLPKYGKILEESGDTRERFIKLKKCKEWLRNESSLLADIRNFINKDNDYFMTIQQNEITSTLDLIAKQGTMKLGLARYNVRMCDDKNQCQISGICQLTNNKMVLSDTANKRLKILDKNLSIVSSYEFIENPRGLCAINETDVAVGMENNTIQIVRVSENVKVLRSLKIENDCSYPAYANDNLHIALVEEIDQKDPIQIYKYSIDTGENVGTITVVDDTKLQSFGFVSKTGSQSGFSFGSPQTQPCKQSNTHKVKQINRPLCFNQTHLYVTKIHKKAIPTLIVCDKEGKRIVSKTVIGSILGICNDDQGNVYVCSSDELNKIEVDVGVDKLPDIKVVSKLSKNDGVNGMLSIAYMSSVGRIIIGCEKCDFIYMV